MSPEASEPRPALLARVLNRLDDRVGDGLPGAAAALARAYLAGLTADDADSADADEVADAVASLLELARQRKTGHAAVRIWNPIAETGGRPRGTVIEIVNDDMPFLVDSIGAALRQREIEIHLFVHLQMAVARDGDRLEGLFEPADVQAAGRTIESLMRIEVSPQGMAGPLVELQDELHDVLAEVRSAVDDWKPMQARVAAIRAALSRTSPDGADPEALENGIRFLDWLLQNHFTLLGCCDYRLQGADRRKLEPVADTALGIVARGELRRDKVSSARFLDGPNALRIAKSTRRSRVHRPVHMDLIAVKWVGENGELIGERRILGLFTSRVYSIAVSDIPLLSKKVDRVLERAAFLPRSHDFKALRVILERYPRDELLQISENDLHRFALRILSLQLRPRTALLVRYDQAGRYASCMVFVPKDRHSTEQRLLIQALLEEAFVGQVTAFFTRFSDLPLAQLHFVVRLHGKDRRGHDLAAIERRVAAVTLSWSDKIKRALTANLGEEAGLAEWRRSRDAFPVAYRVPGSVETAIADLPLIDRALRTGRLALRLEHQRAAQPGRFVVRTFERGDASPLSRYLPVFENLGLQVRSESPFEVRLEDATWPVWVRAFDVRAKGPIDVAAVAARFEEAFLRTWSGEVENDPFNRLVLGAGLAWRQVVVLRAYARYLQQIGQGFSQRYTAETLVRHAGVAGALLELFRARLDPACQDSDADAACATLAAHVRKRLEGVDRVDQDLILRRFLRLIESSLRTNFFQSTEAGNPKPYLSIKLDTQSIPDLPAPRPLYEVFVYAPRFEAVHLRGSAVARGGIRWSDRREDYRTEILGLVKAQRVKNAVIVPGGAKGGFVLKRPPSGREALVAEARSCYRSMMRGLLDITDNYVAGELVPPPDVVRRDGDDPYLVVAADKGTATFSDLANGVAAEYGYWLGDAFASGGSAGYDHKRMGITARGAWESVREHFRSMGIDVNCEPVTVVGVGDMSGDVFGNGMLLSRHVRLLGAFNHLHIFVDPNPDPVSSFAERERLFALERSSWDAYDSSKLSAGGAVFDRQAKQIEVSKGVKERFGLAGTETTPSDLMRSILALDVDLLWFGGIGTYVKDASETHAQVGDRANDDLRLDAGAVRAQVIGEGANLGVTQAGRVAFARQGGRINTDFIDNVGGVDCSDHEVNIKIALAEAAAAGRTLTAARDDLLESMTAAVTELVLENNRRQARALSQVEARAAELVDDHGALIDELERSGRLDRSLEGLPGDGELAERDAGLTRPELAILLAYAKLSVKSTVLASDLPDHPRFTADLIGYFPAQLQQELGSGIETHRLRREIVATRIASGLVDRVGPSFVSKNARATGSAPIDVVRAYIAARDIFAARRLWSAFEAIEDRTPLALQLSVGAEIADLLDRATRWLLRQGPGFDLDTAVAAFARDLRALAKDLERSLPASSRKLLRRRKQTLEKQGAPRRLARKVAALPFLLSGFDIARLAQAAKVDVESAGLVYYVLGERFRFDRLRRASRKLKLTDRWQRQMIADTVEELHLQQARLARRIVEASDARPRKAVAAWIDSHPLRVAHFDRLYADAEAGGKLDVTLLAVLAQELRRLAER